MYFVLSRENRFWKTLSYSALVERVAGVVGGLDFVGPGGHGGAEGEEDGAGGPRASSLQEHWKEEHQTTSGGQMYKKKLNSHKCGLIHVK